MKQPSSSKYDYDVIHETGENNKLPITIGIVLWTIVLMFVVFL